MTAGTFRRADERFAARGMMSEQVMAELQRRILSGELPAGIWLRHDSIAEEFTISRTPVREALRMLATQGLVEIVPNRGARVNGPDVRDILELGEVRAALEGLAAKLATDRIADAHIDQLQSVWDGFRTELDSPESERSDTLANLWAEANDTFHTIVLIAAGNRQLTNTITDLRRRLPHNLSYPAYSGSTRLLRRNIAEHEAIAEAIRYSDGDRAQQLMAEHIGNAVEAMVRRINDRQSVRSHT